jgi:uncharacterized membrane protein YhaH (DUF805 family)
MNFPLAVQTCLKKYADFNGRAGRPEYWWFFLGQFLVMLVLGMVSETLSLIAMLGLLLPGLAVGVRRMHDIGKSGWLILIGLIPFIGWLVLLYFFVQPSGPANDFGAGPFEPEVPALPPGAA